MSVFEPLTSNEYWLFEYVCASWRRLYVTWWCATAAESGNCEWCRLRLKWPSGGADCVTSLYLRVAEHSVWFSGVPENKPLGFWSEIVLFTHRYPSQSSSSTWCRLIVTVTVKVKCQLRTCDFCRVINITSKVTWRSLSLSPLYQPCIQVDLAYPVPECLHSGFYWSEGWWRWSPLYPVYQKMSPV